MDEGKAEIKTLDGKSWAQLETADEPPPLLHPEMAGLFRQKVTTLAQAWSAQKRARRPRKRSVG